MGDTQGIDDKYDTTGYEDRDSARSQRMQAGCGSSTWQGNTLTDPPEEHSPVDTMTTAIICMIVIVHHAESRNVLNFNLGLSSGKFVLLIITSKLTQL